MKEIHHDRLVEMVTNALERTCFMLSDPSDAGSVSGNGYALDHGARIAYTGPECGSVHVAASGGFLEELASSLLGCEPEDVDLAVDGRDAVNELANILGGSVTLELGSESRDYSLGLPEATDAAVPEGGTDAYFQSTSGALRVTWLAAARQRSKAA